MALPTFGICSISGQKFAISPLEWNLRQSFGFNSVPSIAPEFRFRELGAFWPHWTMHRRNCDRSGKSIISIFRPDCPFPVWNRDDWIAHTAPPQRKIDFSKSFFDQAWELFSRCPIPHTFQNHNQNCEYADDLFYSKNCYLVHSSANLEDCRYCYYCNYCKDSQYSVFSQHLELCSDAVHSSNCHNAIYIVDCRQVNDSAFLYDCRNCSNCMFCTNLRNKQYCFENQQLSKEEYSKKIAEWNNRSRKTFNLAKDRFLFMLSTAAWHRATYVDLCQDSYGNFLRHCKNCEDSYLITEHEDSVHNAISGPHSRSTLDCMGSIGGERSFGTVMCVYCYETRFSFELHECRFCDYSAYCFQCKNCFGCCGLVGEEYCIFNVKYSPEEYKKLRDQLINHMESTREWGRFFPGYFAPNPYDESCSGFYFPLKEDEQRSLGFRTASVLHRKESNWRAQSDVPDSILEVANDNRDIYWDENASRPFSITNEDIASCKKLHLSPPDSYYMTRIQENFRFVPFAGKLRDSTCAKTRRPIKTGWPSEYEGRILSEEAYVATIL